MTGSVHRKNCFNKNSEHEYIVPFTAYDTLKSTGEPRFYKSKLIARCSGYAIYTCAIKQFSRGGRGGGGRKKNSTLRLIHNAPVSA